MIWRRRTLDLVPEAYFIERVLLGDLGRPLRVIAADQLSDAPCLDDVLVVSLATEFAPFLALQRRRGMRRVMLLHLGDEQGTDDRTFYSDADLVLRNYWFESIIQKGKTEWVPNGYAVGVGPAARNTRLRASQRSKAGFFAGALGMRTLSHERHAMRAAVERAAAGFELRFTATARDRLGALAYAASLADARFALVPGGNSPETIRLYDALEMGAVPIMLRTPFVAATDALNGPPFPILEDWTQFAAAYAPFADGSRRALAALDALQDDVIGWWDGFKRAQQKKLRELIDAVMDP